MLATCLLLGRRRPDARQRHLGASLYRYARARLFGVEETDDLVGEDTMEEHPPEDTWEAEDSLVRAIQDLCGDVIGPSSLALSGLARLHRVLEDFESALENGLLCNTRIRLTNAWLRLSLQLLAATLFSLRRLAVCEYNEEVAGDPTRVLRVDEFADYLGSPQNITFWATYEMLRRGISYSNRLLTIRVVSNLTRRLFGDDKEVKGFQKMFDDKESVLGELLQVGMLEARVAHLALASLCRGHIEVLKFRRDYPELYIAAQEDSVFHALRERLDEIVRAQQEDLDYLMDSLKTWLYCTDGGVLYRLKKELAFLREAYPASAFPFLFHEVLARPRESVYFVSIPESALDGDSG